MEAVRDSETTVNLYRTTRRHILEAITLHSHRYDNLKSYEASCVIQNWIFKYYLSEFQAKKS
jgi:hypothetical protein